MRSIGLELSWSRGAVTNTDNSGSSVVRGACRLSRAFLAVLSSMFLLGIAPAEEPLLINVDGGNPPFMYEQGGRAEGIYPKIISAAFARIGQPVIIEAKPWRRGLSEIDEGKAGVGGIYRNEERDRKYDFSVPIMRENVAVYFCSDRPLVFRGIHDLKGKKVGVLRGWSYGNEFDAARKAGFFSVDESPSDRANLLKLTAGRLDVVLSIEESGRAVIVAEALTGIERSSVFLTSNYAYLAFSKTKSKKALLEKFNRAIAEMRQDGSFDRIVAKELAR